MRLSTKGRYAVTAIVDIANNSRGNPVALAEISRRQSISLSYLEQLFSRLRRAELVKSVRGPGGGYLLGRDIEDIKIAEIVRAVDAQPNGGAANGVTNGAANGDDTDGLPGAEPLWAELDGLISFFLGSVTVGDVCSGRVRGAGNALTRSGDFSAVAE